MSRLIFSLVAIVAFFALDFYVYRNWRRFARVRRGLRWTLPVYAVLMPVMALALPLYFAVSNWWEVQPKLARGLFIGLWLVYYVPKLVIALVLVVKDLARFVVWLFRWFQERLKPQRVPAGNEVAEPLSTEQTLDLTDMKRISRAEFLRQIGWTAASVPFVVVGYGVFRSLYDFTVHRVDVPIAGLPRALDGLTIAQVSDLHAGSFFSHRPMQEAVAYINDLRPALIAITGDFVNHDDAELEVIDGALHALRADLGVFGCLGNHDHYARVDAVVGRVQATPVDLLVNEHRTLYIDGARLHVIGTDNTGFRQRFADLPAALDGLDADPNGEEVRLLLAHDPTFWDTYVRPDYPDIDLMLGGHTHGGQVGIELGPLRWSLAKTVYQRWAGLYVEDRPGGPHAARGPQYLYVNRGLGTVGPPIRLGIRPEITLLTLKRVAG